VNIIIAGAGKVGYRLANTLSHKHNVTIVDKNEAALQRLQESIDVFAVAGNIEDPDTYRPLKNRHFDIFIAVTDSDEANILSTLIAGDVIEAENKIIRLKNHYFADSSIAGKLGISTAVFPFSATANSVSSLLDFPHANNIKSFIYSPFRMISVFVHAAGEAGIPVSRYTSDVCNVVGIERKKRFFLPEADTTLLQGDLVYLFGDPDRLKIYSAELNPSTPTKISRVAIFGADLLGLEIAKALLQKGVHLKIVDKDIEKCRKASELLQENATVINSRYIEHTLFDDEQRGRREHHPFSGGERARHLPNRRDQQRPRTLQPDALSGHHRRARPQIQRLLHDPGEDRFQRRHLRTPLLRRPGHDFLPQDLCRHLAGRQECQAAESESMPELYPPGRGIDPLESETPFPPG